MAKELKGKIHNHRIPEFPWYQDKHLCFELLPHYIPHSKSLLSPHFHCASFLTWKAICGDDITNNVANCDV